jgi:hypothetical protein
MKLLKEKSESTTRAITTLFIGSTLLLGFMAMMSMPQMIGSAYAQSERGSERACKELPGATLERGQCEAPAKETVTFTCKSVFGQTPTPTGDPKTCTASTRTAPGQETQKAEQECTAAGGTPKTTGGNPKTVTCTYPATRTVTLTCPNDIEPIDGKCITKPGNRSEEEV